MGKLVRHGKFSKPLYHVTSDLFLPQIKKFGLGGLDPVSELNLITIYRNLVDLGEEHLGDQGYWAKIRPKIEAIYKQEISTSKEGYNFSHGATYLTLDESIARRYIGVAKHGCEILSNIRILLKLLFEKGLEEGCVTIVPQQVANILGREHTPVVLKLKDVPYASVESENGMDKDLLLRGWERAIKGKEIEVEFQNWRLVSPVDWCLISIIDRHPVT